MNLKRWPVIVKTCLAGAGLSAIYWLVVSLVYAFLFHKGNIFDALLPSDGFLLWERVIAAVLLFAVHFSMHYATYGHRSVRQKLSVSETRYRNLFETMAQGVIYHDSEGRVISANPSAVKILGVSLERLSRSNILDGKWKAVRDDGSNFPAEEHPVIVALRTGNEVKNVVMGIFNPVEQKLHWINISATPQFQPGSPRPYQAFTTFDDITTPKEMENKLKDSEAFSNSLLENAPNPIIVLNPDGAIRYVNPAFEKLSGYSWQEISGREKPFPWWPETPAGPYSEETVRGTEALTPEVRRYQKKTGEDFWIILNIKNVEEGGQLKYYLVSWLDISQRIRSEEALQQSEQKLKKVFDSVADGIIIVDVTSRVIDCNDNALSLLQFPSKAELSTCNLVDLILNEDRFDARQKLLDVSDKGASYNLNCTCRRRDKTSFPAEVSSRVARDNSGKPLFVVISFRDITERKAMEDRIVELYESEKGQREELQEEARMRGLFIDILAHELKNPLTPILISSGMLKGFFKEPGGVHNQLVNNIYDSAETLSTRLEELLDLARFSRGQINLKIQTVEIPAFLEEVAARFSPGLNKSNQKLILDMQDDIFTTEIDPSRMEQVVINLLSNASKFSSSNGRIELKARLRDKEVLIEVKDEGIGISIEDQQSIFKPYHRVRQDKHNIPGLGLGLAVSKQIVEAHGGKIRVDSQPGHGSTFIISLPEQNKKEKSQF